VTTTASLPFVFESAEVPAETRGGRKADPNPYTDVVTGLHAKLVETGNVEALKFHVSAFEKSEKDVQAESGKILRQLRQVGANATQPYTVRTKTDVSSTVVGKGATAKTIPTTLVTFWIHSVERDGKNVPALIEKSKKSDVPAAASETVSA